MNPSLIGLKRVQNTVPSQGQVQSYDGASGKYAPGAISDLISNSKIFNEKKLVAGDITAGFADYDTSSPTWTTESADGGYLKRWLFDKPVKVGSYYYICCGYGGSRIQTVYKSTDGISWTLAGNFIAYNQGPCVESFNDKLWLMGGNDNVSGDRRYVYYSTDGANWTQATALAGWSGRQRARCCVFNNKLWIMGGRTSASGTGYNDVWYSSDGANWTQATASAGWSTRYDHGLLVMGGKMWVMGGMSGATVYNDVWYSTDGATWTQAKQHAAWSDRCAFAAIVYNEKLHIFGGYTTTQVDDCWYSADGVTWYEFEPGAWAARSGHATFMVGSEVFLVGGYSTDYCKDVYSYAAGEPLILSADRTVLHWIPYNVVGDYYSTPVLMRNQSRAAVQPSDYAADGSKIYFGNTGGHSNLTTKPLVDDILLLEELP